MGGGGICNNMLLVKNKFKFNTNLIFESSHQGTYHYLAHGGTVRKGADIKRYYSRKGDQWIFYSPKGEHYIFLNKTKKIRKDS